MVFSTEDLVLIEVLCQEKGYDIDDHTASLQITVNVRVCHGNLVIENVMKYDLYVKFPQIFAHNV